MMRKLLTLTLFAALTLSAADARVFELRTYYTKEGKLDDLLKRFREHTTALFEKHHMTNIGYWVPTDKPNQLVYIVSHESRDAAKTNWSEFGKDPDWVKVKTASEAAGPIVDHVDSVYMTSTDFSKIK